MKVPAPAKLASVGPCWRERKQAWAARWLPGRRMLSIFALLLVPSETVGFTFEPLRKEGIQGAPSSTLLAVCPLASAHQSNHYPAFSTGLSDPTPPTGTSSDSVGWNNFQVRGLKLAQPMTDPPWGREAGASSLRGDSQVRSGQESWDRAVPSQGRAHQQRCLGLSLGSLTEPQSHLQS